jgi:oligopeptidase B
VFHEPDEAFRLGIGRSRSGRFLEIAITNASTTEWRLAPADRPDRAPEVVIPRRKGAKYQVEHAGTSLFVLTNVGPDDVPNSAVNHRLLELPLAGGPPIERIAHRDDAELRSIQGFADHLVVSERVRGQLGVRVIDLRTGEDRQVRLPEVPCVIGPAETPEYASGVVRLRYSSLTTPSTDYDLDLRTLALTRLKELPVPGYDRTRYRTERIEATAPDGVKIPMSVVYHADLDLRAHPHAALLYGYGAYGITIEPTFSIPRVSLLDRGVVFVIAHVRGGGFLGRSWYEAGKLQHKMRSFTDFVACARHLIDLGVTAPDKLVASGGSAGGLLVGAAMNLAPELFKGVFAAVPFVDVLTTMLDRTLPLTIPEYDEWGDPREREVFDRILAYSPYDNVRPARYPDLLATGGWNDPRVSYWEPAKWVARLRERATGGEFLLKTQLGAGHQGPSGRYGMLEERAFEYAWLLHELGL